MVGPGVGAPGASFFLHICKLELHTGYIERGSDRRAMLIAATLTENGRNAVGRCGARLHTCVYISK